MALQSLSAFEVFVYPPHVRILNQNQITLVIKQEMSAFKRE
jgi:hypothetical protein